MHNDIKYLEDTKVVMRYPLINLDDLVKNNIIKKTQIEYKYEIQSNIININDILNIPRVSREYQIREQSCVNDDYKLWNELEEYMNIIGYTDIILYGMTNINRVDVYFGDHNIYSQDNKEESISLPIFRFDDQKCKFVIPTLHDAIIIKLTNEGGITKSCGVLGFYGVIPKSTKLFGKSTIISHGICPVKFMHYISHKIYYMPFDNDYMLLYCLGTWNKLKYITTNTNEINSEYVVFPNTYNDYFLLELLCKTDSIYNINIPGFDDLDTNMKRLNITLKSSEVKREYYIKNKYMADVKTYLSSLNHIDWKITKNNIINVQDFFKKEIVRHINNIQMFGYDQIAIDII
jgi:hypothetical protein